LQCCILPVVGSDLGWPSNNASDQPCEDKKADAHRSKKQDGSSQSIRMAACLNHQRAFLPGASELHATKYASEERSEHDIQHKPGKQGWLEPVQGRKQERAFRILDDDLVGDDGPKSEAAQQCRKRQNDAEDGDDVP